MTPVQTATSEDGRFESTEPGVPDGSDSAESESEPNNRTWRLRAIEWSLLAVAPVLVASLYGIERFYQLSGADPFIYTGYATSTADLMERFGYPYYAVRFALILPSNLFIELFGATAGYYALRWLLTVIATAAVYTMMRRRFGWQAGAVAVVMLLLSPTYLRAMMTMYSTTVGVPAIAAGFAIILLTGTTRMTILRCALAGLLFGAAVNSNPFSALPVAAVLAAWTVSRSPSRWKETMAGLGAAALGVLAVTGVGAIIYGVRFGDPNIIAPSLTAADRLSSGPSPDKEPGLAWMNFRPEIWLPVVASLLVLTALGVRRTTTTWVERCIAVTPVAMWSAYAVHQFVLGSNTLEIYFYSSYMIGPTVVALAAAVAIMNQAWDPRLNGVRWAACIAAVLAGPVLWTHLGRALTIWTLNGVIPIALVTIALIWFARRSLAITIAGSVLICLLPLAMTVAAPRNVPLAEQQRPRQEPRYDTLYFRSDDISIDLYEAAVTFSSSVPRTHFSPGSVVFWFPAQDYLASLMQWTYVGPFTTLQTPESPSLPELDQQSIDLLKQRTPRFLIVISSTRELMDQARATLASLGLPLVERRATVIEEGHYVVFVTTYEFVPDSCDLESQGDTTFWNDLPLCRDG